MDMGKGIIVLLSFVASSTWFLHPIATANALPPVFSPLFDGICNSINCGKGSCKTDLTRMIPFVCECDAGWTQFHVQDSFKFMPCVIPNCTVNYSCANGSATAAAPPPAPPGNSSIIDPCDWAYCGEGTCMKTSDFGHKCECADGHANLLNITALPCFRECAFGADCSSLGIGLTNSTSSSASASPSLSDSGNAANIACSNFLGNLLWSIILVILSVFQHD